MVLCKKKQYAKLYIQYGCIYIRNNNICTDQQMERKYTKIVKWDCLDALGIWLLSCSFPLYFYIFLNFLFLSMCYFYNGREMSKNTVSGTFRLAFVVHISVNPPLSPAKVKGFA